MIKAAELDSLSHRRISAAMSSVFLSLFSSSYSSLFLSLCGPKFAVSGPRLVTMAMGLATEVNRV